MVTRPGSCGAGGPAESAKASVSNCDDGGVLFGGWPRGIFGRHGAGAQLFEHFFPG